MNRPSCGVAFSTSERNSFGGRVYGRWLISNWCHADKWRLKRYSSLARIDDGLIGGLTALHLLSEIVLCTLVDVNIAMEMFALTKNSVPTRSKASGPDPCLHGRTKTILTSA